MKRLVLSVILISGIIGISGQEGEQIQRDDLPKLAAADSNESLRVIIGKDLFNYQKRDSSVNIRFKEKGLRILESLEGIKVDVEKYDEPVRPDRYSREEEKSKSWQGRHFRGHWAGFEAGFNNYMFNKSMILPDEIAYMDLNTSASNCFNFNISQVNIGITRRIGFVSGLGLNLNNYRFENNNNIAIGPDGIITEMIPESQIPVKKSRFSTLYLTAPILLEFQIPAGYSHSLNISGGFIGGLKLNAWTKIIYEDGEKTKVNGDYNLNLLRGGVTARAGYGNLQVFGTYYFTPWFQNLKGPEGLNPEPFEIGLSFTFND